MDLYGQGKLEHAHLQTAVNQRLDLHFEEVCDMMEYMMQYNIFSNDCIIG